MKIRKLKKEEKGGELQMSQEINPITQRVERTKTEIKWFQLKFSPSEAKALYPDTSIEESFLIGGLKNLTAREAMGLILVFPRTSPLYLSILLEIAEKAYQSQYQGLWIKTQKLCELRLLELQLYYLFESGFTENEIFGNLLKIGNHRLKRVRIFTPTGPVTYPIRRRGYKDKGSRREESKWLPKDVWIGPNPPKRDRRNLIGNIRRTLTNFLYK